MPVGFHRSEYSRPPVGRPESRPTRTKAASVADITPSRFSPDTVVGDPEVAVRRALGSVQRLKQAAETARIKVSGCKDRLISSLSELALYFKQADHKPFNEVYYMASRRFSKAAEYALDFAYLRANLTEPRDGMPKYAAAYNPSEQPYPLITTAIARGTELLDAQKQATLAQQELLAKGGEQ